MFGRTLREATLFVARIHELLLSINDGFEFQFGDKQLHFIVMLVIGMMMFFVVNAIFQRLARFSVTAISFIYVFTMMTVLGMAIEIGQKITGTGNMDFGDVVAGLYGVLVFFAVYASMKVIVYSIRRLTGREKRK